MERLSAPFITVLAVTGKCNLNCVYCYAHPSPPEHVPADVIVRLVCELHHLQVFQIILGGGEPFLHPHVFEILESIFEFRDQITVLTNGTQLDDAFCRRLAAYGQRGKYVHIQVSLDAVQATVNDSVRGLTAETIAAIERLASYQLSPQIAVVIHRKNLQIADQVIDFFYPRVKHFHYMNLMPSTKLVENDIARQELCLDSPTLRRFYEALHEKVKAMPSDLMVSGCTGEVSTTANQTSMTSGDRRWSAPGCLAGVTRCDIDARLNVLACSMAPKAILGSVVTQSFSSVWHSEMARCIAEISVPLCCPEGADATVRCTNCWGG